MSRTLLQELIRDLVGGKDSGMMEKFVAYQTPPYGLPLGREVWSDTNIVVPFANAARYYNIYVR
jgi:hypothetical protein